MSPSSKIAGGLFAAALLAGLAAPADAATRSRLDCHAQLAGQDVSATARFERIGQRRKFTVEVEAAVRSSFRPGDILIIEVDNVRVGRIRLVRRAVNLVGDLNVDTTATAGDQARPFPPQFPAVSAGTVVEAGPMRCALQRR
jgi:hypothetical protein